MNLRQTIDLYGSGTSEGAQKTWETRDRGDRGLGNKKEVRFNEKEKKWEHTDGSKLPEHIAHLVIPPAWKEVEYSDDPDAELLVKGKDEAGRGQSLYSAKHTAESAAEKFERVAELNEKLPKITAEVTRDVVKGVEEAVLLRLVIATGLRAGSNADTGAKVKAFGATTLKGVHVVPSVDGKTVRLKFIGKKGVANSIKVDDPEMVKDLITRKAASGPKGKLFDTNNSKLSDYAGTLDGGGFHTKDFRTLLGTRTAMAALAKIKPPKNEADYKKKVKEVATIVSDKLGNTPTVALQSYISPTVFADWISMRPKDKPKKAKMKKAS